MSLISQELQVNAPAENSPDISLPKAPSPGLSPTPPATSSPSVTQIDGTAISLNGKDGRAKPRSDKQKAATERMKQAREAKRKAPASEPGETEERDKAMALATAMFMDMRKKQKEEKKELAWEKQLDKIVTGRMDEFEERLVNMFSEPIDHFLSRRKPKKAKIDEEKTESVPSSKPKPPPPSPKTVIYKSNNPFANFRR